MVSLNKRVSDKVPNPVESKAKPVKIPTKPVRVKAIYRVVLISENARQVPNRGIRYSSGNERVINCTVEQVPILAPRMMPKALRKLRYSALTKPIVIKDTAVLLWKRAAAIMPRSKPRSGVFVAVRRRR